MMLVKISSKWKETITGKKEWHFRIEYRDWIIEGRTRNVSAKDFDIHKENQLVLNCKKKILEVFIHPNKYEKRLARKEGIPIENPITKRLWNGIIYVNDKDYFCGGAGAIGQGKVFWTPYTSRNEWRQKIINADIGCDNCRVLAHEDVHAIGSHAEFDLISYLIGIYFRFENFPENKWGRFIMDEIFSWALGAEGYALGKRNTYTRECRNAFCALYTRYPRETIRVLKLQGLSDNRIRNIIKTCL